MGKAIETKVKACNHPIIKFIGMQEGVVAPVGNCYECTSTISITGEYRYVLGEVYELFVKEGESERSS